VQFPLASQPEPVGRLCYSVCACSVVCVFVCVCVCFCIASGHGSEGVSDYIHLASLPLYICPRLRMVAIRKS
jgi:hypothetical protein